MTLESNSLFTMPLDDERPRLARYVERLDETLAASSPTATERTIELLLARSRALQFMRRDDDAVRDCAQARSVAESAGARTLVADAEARLASIALERRDLDQALRHVERAVRAQAEATAAMYRTLPPGPVANETERRALLVGPAGTWFRLGREPRSDLRRRRSARLILDALVEQRLHVPGKALSIEALVAKGWPGEVMYAASARNRLYMTVLLLRNWGLRDVLLAQDGGYLLDPELEVLTV